MIIFDEKAQYDNLMENGFKKFVNITDLSILGREWVSQGFSKGEVKQKMIEFSAKFCPTFNESKYENRILKALERAFSGKSIKSSEIVFYKEEMDKLVELKDKALQKVIFIMMCLAKKDRHKYIYLNTAGIYKLAEIYKLAGVKATKIKQEESLYNLRANDAIFCNLRPFLRYDLLFIRNKGKEVMRFTPQESMLDEFKKYLKNKK